MTNLSVETHGNGFMVLGTVKIKKARKELKDYVDSIKPYKFACPTWYEGGNAVWLSTAPGAVWEGSLDHTGSPLPR